MAEFDEKTPTKEDNAATETPRSRGPRHPPGAARRLSPPTVPNAVADAVSALAEDRGCSEALVVADAVTEYVEKHQANGSA